MDFDGALRFLETTTNESVSRRHPGRLDRMRAFCTLLGDPQDDLRCIHVGGTAGKGSTASMCGAILRAAGYRVGLHTKPHLHSVTERASIDGAPVSEARFADLLSSLLPAIGQMERTEWGRPSYFEILVALSFRLFAQERVGVAVIEVGIGGRLDGTNLIRPLVAVLTNVGLDHADVLGDTVEAVARDKSGIIKPGVVALTAATQPEALRVIREAAELADAPLTIVQKAATIEPLAPPDAYGQRFRVATPARAYDISLPLLGAFQRINAATAILACESVGATLPTSVDDVVRGLHDLTLAGRMEYHPARPSLLFDVAHNAEKARALRQALEDHFPGRRFTFVVAIAEGKDATGMIDAWAGLPTNFIFTNFSVAHRRSIRPHHLALLAGARGLTARAVDDPVEALSLARRIAAASDLVVVTGSTFVVATLRDWFLVNAAVERAGARA